MGRMNGGQAHTTAAKHSHRGARLQLCTVDHRAIARQNPATQQRRQVQRHVFADFDDSIFVHQHLLSKS
jgi:hypothetical protein